MREGLRIAYLRIPSLDLPVPRLVGGQPRGAATAGLMDGTGGIREDPAIETDAGTKAAVRAALDRLAEVYVTRDVDLLRAVFAPDPDVVMYSPGAKEGFVGISEIVAKAVSDWSRSESARLEYRRTSVSAVGPVAWVAAEADFTVKASGQETTTPVRVTFVLEQRDEGWLIVHAHYSLA